jgi:hypothetical protein
MRLLAVVKNPAGIARYLAAPGELTDVPGRLPPRVPPYGKSQVLRRKALGDEGEIGDNPTDHEAAYRADGKPGTPPRVRSLANQGVLGPFRPQRGRRPPGRLRAQPRTSDPNDAGPTPIAAPRPREREGKPPSNRLRSRHSANDRDRDFANAPECALFPCVLHRGPASILSGRFQLTSRP